MLMSILRCLFCRYLHLAVIHEAKDHAMKMIDLSVNDPFLNVQNYQRQVHQVSCLHILKMHDQKKGGEKCSN